MPPVKIAVADLCPGMFIVDMGIPWLQAPLLYTKEGLIASEEEIADILKQGYAEAYYDPEQSSIRPLPGISIDIEPAAPDSFTEPRAPLAEELAQARVVYDASYTYVKNFMRAARSGPVDLAASEPHVEAIINSLNRNVNALISLSKLKNFDEYTYAHSVNVTIFAVAFARFLGVSEDKLYLAGMAGLLHDYGKALIPPAILNAPRRLTDKEFEIMRSHVRLGYDQLKGVKDIAPEILDGLGEHHEKHNGKGYPRQLVGGRISLFGRILSVSDTYDALSARRVYKEPLQPGKALAIMYGMRGQAWAPGLVESFIKMLGIYPAGTAVEISNGERGVVCRANPSFPALPSVIVAQSPDGQALQPRTLDLSRHRGLGITRALLPLEARELDIAALLGDPQAAA